MYWALFGLGDPQYVELKPFNNHITELYGTLLYGSYHFASIFVLMNILVASMTLSFERVLVN
jgi:hypothetical protein